MTLTLDGSPLSAAAVVGQSRAPAGVRLADAARRRVEAARNALAAACTEGRVVYGATSGVGTRDGARVAGADAERLQASLLRSHAMGVGEPAPDEMVRAMMLVRASQLAMGRSGITPAVLDAVVAMIDRGVVPRVPALGSVGASDLAPLAHAALPLLGEGAARVGGRGLTGAEALAALGIERPRLGGRDALAWMNAPAYSVAQACFAREDGRRLLDAAEMAAALTMAALGSHKGAFAPEQVRVKPQPGVVRSAERLWALLPDAGTDAREPLSIRCLPQLLGAARHALETLADAVETELAAPADNPVCVDGAFFGGGAAFDTHHLARVLDGLADALLPVAAASERRIARLLDPSTNGGLPPFLIGASGRSATVSSGLMIAQYTAASLVATLRARGAASGLGAPTCQGFEDAVSMAPLSARRALDGLADLARVVAIESIVASQALALRGAQLDGLLAPGLARVRRACPPLEADRALGEPIEALARGLLREPARAAPRAGELAAPAEDARYVSVG